MNTIIGVFDDPQVARRALEALRDSPLELEDISIISRDRAASGAENEDVSAGEGATVGAVWGGLVGLTALLIPGIGPFIAGGALFATLTGVVTGAVVGGIAAGLIDFSGIPEEDARGYEDEINQGKTLIAVRAREQDIAAVRQILQSDGASAVRDEVHTTMPPGSTLPRVAMYDPKGGRIEHVEDAQAMAVGASARRYGVYNAPDNDRAGQQWTGGQMVGEGQGSGPRNTGEFDADQWVGEGQGPGKTPGDTWTSGEAVGEGQGSGPRTDTGTYDARQWVGEGQGDGPPAGNEPRKTR